MDEKTKQIISKQTNIEDLVLIEKTYFECDNDVGATVLKLMNITYKSKPKPPRTQFDDYREILDDKDTVYQQIVANSKKST